MGAPPAVISEDATLLPAGLALRRLCAGTPP
jgi:hypothetical protein